MAILSYKNLATREISEKLSTKSSRRLLPAELHKIAFLKLSILDSTESLEELKTVPGLRLEALRGDRKGQYSIRINSKYRICFIWENKNAYFVEIIDYH